MIAHSNPQLSTFAASQHVYSMPQKHDRVLMSQDPARNVSHCYFLCQQTKTFQSINRYIKQKSIPFHSFPYLPNGLQKLSNIEMKSPANSTQRRSRASQTLAKKVANF